jgi:hypothetical protein
VVNRDVNGHLQKGSILNPKGRPKKDRERDYLDIMLNIVTPKRWTSIVNKAADQAERGDAVARKWLADYIIGAPVQRQEVTGLEGGAIEIIVTYEDKPPTPETP